jgi:fructokinase
LRANNVLSAVAATLMPIASATEPVFHHSTTDHAAPRQLTAMARWTADAPAGGSAIAAGTVGLVGEVPAGAGAAVVFAAILGTGVGAGIAIDARPLSGAHGIAGEWGHVPLPAPRDDERPGPRCWCGRDGCLETWLSGPALSADHHRVTGVAIDAIEIAARAGTGDPACAASLERWLDRLARGLAMVVDLIDPDVIVLGGGLSNIAALYDTLPARIAPRVFSDAWLAPVRRSAHGDSSGVRGAAWLWGDPTDR